MSIFKETFGNGLGSKVFHNFVYGDGVIALDLNDSPGDENSNESVSFGIANGSLFESFPLNVPNTIFSEFKFKVNRGGNCLDFSFEFNRLPDVPILKFTTVQINIANIPRFFGYITKRPQDGEDGKLRFSGYGSWKRIAKRKFFNDERFIVNDIAASGSDMIISVSGFISGDKTGQKVIIKDHVEDKNNGIFDISSNTSSDITVLNPSRVASTAVTGLAIILPAYWVDSVLISEFLKSTLDNHFNKENVSYLDSKISDTTGVVTAGASNFEGMEFSRFSKIIENILENKYWFGIDGRNEFFLTEKPIEKITTFFAGYDLPEASISIDEEVDGNAITIYRSGNKSGRSKGSVIAGTSSDATSIAKFGESVYSEDIPAWLSDEIGQKYSDALLTVMSQPSISAKAENMPYRWYNFGYYGYVTEVGFYNFDLLDFDSLIDWTTGANISATLSNTILVNGANSHRLELTASSINETHVKTGIGFKCSGAKVLTLFIRTNTPVKLQIGFGVLYTDNVFDVSLNGLGKFEPIKIDLSSLTLGMIEEFGIKIIDCENALVYFDYGVVNMYSNKHYELELDEAEYLFLPGERKVNLKFGDTRKNAGLGEYISGIKSQVELSKQMLRE